MSVKSMESSGSWEVEAQESLVTETRGLLLFCEDDYEHPAETTTRRGGVVCNGRQALFKLAAQNYNHQEDSNFISITESAAASSSSDGESVTLNIEELQQRKSIVEIVRNKNLDDLRNFKGGVKRGVEGVAEALNTHLENGISSTPQQQTLLNSHHTTQLYKFLVILIHSFLKASNNKTIFLLSTAAILSFVFGVNEEDETHGFGWLNGAVLISNVFLIIIFTTIHYCWQEWTSNKKLDILGRIKKVRTVRDGGKDQVIGETDLVVGDIVILRKGDQVPGDGLFVIPIGDDDQQLELNDGSSAVDQNNPFLFYGARVINGDAKMLVTSTREDTVWGEMMSQATLQESNCKLESSIHNLNMCVHISGLLISILIIIVLFLRYRAGKMDDERKYRPDPKGEPTRVVTITDAIMRIVRGTKGTAGVLTTLLSVSLLGMLEGVPVVISFATIFWARKMLSGHKATARDNLACLKMASVTTLICTDRFGGLTEHDEYKIDKLFVGEDIVSESSVVDSQVLEGLCDGITAMQLLIPHTDSESATLVPEVIYWAEANLGLKTASVIEKCKMTSYGGRNPFQERCQMLVEKNGNVKYSHFSGPPLDILSVCSHHYDINGEHKEIDDRKRNMLEGMFADQEARVVAYACKRVVVQDLDEEALIDVHPQPNGDDDLIILLAVIILKEVKIEDTKAAVSALMEGGGVRTIIASGDDISVLEPIGRNCGLIAAGSEDHLAVITGQEFRNWSDEERMENLNNIRVIGNCIPSDKILLVKCLRKKGEVVALLAQRTTDAPALKQADIGLTFGTWSSQVARECCDINIWDFNCLGFLVNVVKSGKCFQDNIRKFIQFQLVFTISSTLITFIAVVSLGDAPITPVQLFWLNLVVALFGGLALLAGPTMKISSTVTAKLISKAMWRNIAIQAIYQTTIFLILQHKGQDFLETSAGRIKSAIYNGFFLCQLFNLLIAREPEKKNLFGGQLFRNNFWFWVAFVIFVTCQGVFAVAERVLGTSPGLNLKLWGACLLTGLVSLLLDFAGKRATAFYCSLVSERGISRFQSVRSLLCSANEPPTFNTLNSSDLSV